MEALTAIGIKPDANLKTTPSIFAAPAGLAAVRDGLVSAKKGSTLLQSLTNVVLFVPRIIINFVTRIVKSILYVLTCCTFCGDESDPRLVVKALCQLADVWQKPGVTTAEKNQAYREFCGKFPEFPERFKAELVSVIRNAILDKDRNKAQKIQKWNAENKSEVRQEADRRLAEHDPSLVNSMIAHLESKAEKKAGAGSV